jgi:hypothetical protein
MGEPGIAAQQFAVPDVADAAPDGIIDPEFALEEAVEPARHTAHAAHLACNGVQVIGFSGMAAST